MQIPEGRVFQQRDIRWKCVWSVPEIVRGSWRWNTDSKRSYVDEARELCRSISGLPQTDSRTFRLSQGLTIG